MDILKQNIEFEALTGMKYTSVYKLNNAILGEIDMEALEGRMAIVFTDALSRWADARQSLVKANEDEIRNAQRMIDGVKDNSSYSWHMDSRRVNEYVAECKKYEDMLNNLRYIIGVERDTMVAIFRMASQATFKEKAGE
jgi:malate/lactate dehydrogenase